MPLEMDSESGCDAVCQLSTGLSGSYVHVISTRKLHIPALLPSIIVPCWADTDRTTKKKNSLVQIFYKEQLSHSASTAGTIILKSSVQHISVMKQGKNTPQLFFHEFGNLKKKKKKQKQNQDRSFKNAMHRTVHSIKRRHFCTVSRGFGSRMQR